MAGLCERDEHLCCHINLTREQILYRVRQQRQQHQFADDSGYQLAGVGSSLRIGFLLVGCQQYGAVGRIEYFANGGLHGQPYQLRVDGLPEFDHHLCCSLSAWRDQHLFGDGEQWQ